MSERSEALREQRMAAYERQNGRCAHCGGPLRSDLFEMAHLIPDRVWTRKRFGWVVIDNWRNKVATHPGACNSGVQLNPCGLEADALAHRIEDEEGVNGGKA